MEALDRIRECDAEGVEYPVRDYLYCYRVLIACDETGPALAAKALEDGYALLQRRTASFTDASRRQSYLANVPFNRELAAAFERRATTA